MPMDKSFTLEELRPSEKTLNLIRQIAHGYRPINIKGTDIYFCIN